MTSERAGRHPAWRVALGLGVPSVLVVGSIPLLSGLRGAPLGVPLALWWLGACIPLTSACLGGVWLVFDRHADVGGEGRPDPHE